MKLEDLKGKVVHIKHTDESSTEGTVHELDENGIYLLDKEDDGVEDFFFCP